MTEQPYKDSLLVAQDDKIILLEIQNSNKDSLIILHEEKEVIHKKEVKLLRTEMLKRDELCNTEKKEQKEKLKKKVNKWRKISLIQGAFILLSVIIAGISN